MPRTVALPKSRKPGGQFVGVDLLAAGPEVGDAAEDVQRAERDHQRRHVAVADQHAVDRPADRRRRRAPTSSATTTGRPGWSLQQRADGEGAQPEHRADRQVDVAGDHHDGLADRQYGQDRGAEQDVADALAGQEARVRDRGHRDQQRRARARCRARGPCRTHGPSDDLRWCAPRRAGCRRPSYRGLLTHRGEHDRLLGGLGSRSARRPAVPRASPGRGRPCRAPRAAPTRPSGRRRRPRPGRTSAGAPRPWCRRRCRGSARRRSAASAPSTATWPARPSAGCRRRACRPRR